MAEGEGLPEDFRYVPSRTDFLYLGGPAPDLEGIGYRGVISDVRMHAVAKSQPYFGPP